MLRWRYLASPIYGKWDSCICDLYSKIIENGDIVKWIKFDNAKLTPITKGSVLDTSKFSLDDGFVLRVRNGKQIVKFELHSLEEYTRWKSIIDDIQKSNE